MLWCVQWDAIHYPNIELFTESWYFDSIQVTCNFFSFSLSLSYTVLTPILPGLCGRCCKPLPGHAPSSLCSNLFCSPSDVVGVDVTDDSVVEFEGDAAVFLNDISLETIQQLCQLLIEWIEFPGGGDCVIHVLTAPQDFWCVVRSAVMLSSLQRRRSSIRNSVSVDSDMPCKCLVSILHQLIIFRKDELELIFACVQCYFMLLCLHGRMRSWLPLRHGFNLFPIPILTARRVDKSQLHQIFNTLVIHDCFNAFGMASVRHLLSTLLPTVSLLLERHPLTEDTTERLIYVLAECLSKESVELCAMSVQCLLKILTDNQSHCALVRPLWSIDFLIILIVDADTPLTYSTRLIKSLAGCIVTSQACDSCQSNLWFAHWEPRDGEYGGNI